VRTPWIIKFADYKAKGKNMGRGQRYARVCWKGKMVVRPLMDFKDIDKRKKRPRIKNAQIKEKGWSLATEG